MLPHAHLPQTIRCYVEVPPAVQGKEDHHFALAHGEQAIEYILLSDDCEIEKCFNFKTGRIMAAPIREQAEGERLDHMPHFDLYPLLPDQMLNVGRMVLLGESFRVEARDLMALLGAGGNNPPLRLRRLDLANCDGLLQKWSAHIMRRGPIVEDDNVGKLDQLLAARGVADQLRTDVVRTLGALADAMWNYEGNALEDFADVFEQESRVGAPQPLRGFLNSLTAALDQVESQARIAKAYLADYTITSIR